MAHFGPFCHRFNPMAAFRLLNEPSHYFIACASGLFLCRSHLSHHRNCGGAPPIPYSGMTITTLLITCLLKYCCHRLDRARVLDCRPHDGNCCKCRRLSCGDHISRFENRIYRVGSPPRALNSLLKSSACCFRHLLSVELFTF